MTGWPVRVVVCGTVKEAAYVELLSDISKFAGAVIITSAAVKLFPLTVYVLLADAVPTTVVIVANEFVDVVNTGVPLGSTIKV